MDKKSLLKSLTKSSLPYLTAIVLASLVTAIASWAQTTETTFFSYDDAKQLIKAKFANYTSAFGNRTTARRDYV